MSERKIYSARRDRGIAFVLAGSVFVAGGFWYVAETGFNPVTIALLGLGGFVIVAGLSILQARVALDDHGIIKSPWLVGGFKASWEAIEAWGVEPSSGDDSFISRVVQFRIRGRRRPAEVWNSEAHRPSFDAFLEDLRARVKAKEVS